MALGKQVRKYRQSLGLTLEQLSDRSGIEVGTINALENRDSKKSSAMTKLAKGLCLSVEELLDESSDWSAIAQQRQAASGPASSPTPYWRQVRSEGEEDVPRWPLQSVTPSQWSSLGERERGLVEGFVRGLIEGKGGHRKSRKTGTTDN